MNKNDVYRLISYHGEYNAIVKKAIRKLLKDNHPDNKGNREVFELINEVKKELETGKVSYKEQSQKDDLNSNISIDYDYCYEMIDSIKKTKNVLTNDLNQKRNILTNYEKKYKNLYQDSLNEENYLLTNSPYIKKLKGIKLLSIVLVIIMIIIFSISLLKNNNILFVIFIILSIVCILVIQEYILLMHRVSVFNKKSIINYVKMNSQIRNNINKQNEIKKEIRSIEKKLNNLDNDLRFYNNLLK